MSAVICNYCGRIYDDPVGICENVECNSEEFTELRTHQENERINAQEEYNEMMKEKW